MLCDVPVLAGGSKSPGRTGAVMFLCGCGGGPRCGTWPVRLLMGCCGGPIGVGIEVDAGVPVRYVVGAGEARPSYAS